MTNEVNVHRKTERGCRERITEKVKMKCVREGDDEHKTKREMEKE